MQYFVHKDSIVRQIWGRADAALFIFAGSAAEFALNKAVDWLYFTGRLPADPLGRLFSTISYARQIIFSDEYTAHYAIDKMSSIHSAVEKARGTQIPDWAYRDVLFMLIHYSIASYELLYRKLSDEEKQEVFDVFYRVGSRMNLKELPADYNKWLPERKKHLDEDLYNGYYTADLYKQYRRQLGPFRYWLLIEGQKSIAPVQVRKLLGLSRVSFVTIAAPFYKLSRRLKLDGYLKSWLLPKDYKKQIMELDV